MDYNEYFRDLNVSLIFHYFSILSLSLSSLNLIAFFHIFLFYIIVQCFFLSFCLPLQHLCVMSDYGKEKYSKKREAAADAK